MNNLASPHELMARLNEQEDAESALTVIREAHNIIQQYEQAVDYSRRFLAQDLLENDATSRSVEGGNYGWRRELDDEAWEEALTEDTELAQQVETIESVLEAGRKAQKLLTRLQQPYKRSIPGKTLYVRTASPGAE